MTKFAIKTYVLTFKFAAGVNRAFFVIERFLFVIVFWLFFDKFHCVFLFLIEMHSVCVLEANFKIWG